MMDEHVQALRALWTERKATFKGRYTSFEDVETFPKPAQNPLPIFMAGHADPVFRRLAAYGDGWIDSTQQPDELRAHADKLRSYAAEAGRGDAHFEIARQFYVSIARTEEEARATYDAALPPPPGGQPTEMGKPAPAGQVWERSLIGTPDQIRGRLQEYAAAGATELCAIFYYADGESAERQLRLFAEEVMPAFA
jgi:alkanesulfonate monooxygenase SsuD/methylene tetrahydromethanopterin reductase-like flavin-dependent oxidoreductase (luciferase family)